MRLHFLQAQPGDHDQILAIAKNYPRDFVTYYDKFSAMIAKGRVFVVKDGRAILAFCTYGVSQDDPRECFTSSARAKHIGRHTLSGDWIRAQLEKTLLKRGFSKLTAHVRSDNNKAIKMLTRNGYQETTNTSNLNNNAWLQFSKTMQTE